MEAVSKKSVELVAALLKASNEGEISVLCDMSPSLFTMKENMGEGLQFFEQVEFINDHLLQWLEITPVEETIAVFPVCSIKKMGLEDKLVDLGQEVCC